MAILSTSFTGPVLLNTRRTNPTCKLCLGWFRDFFRIWILLTWTVKPWCHYAKQSADYWWLFRMKSQAFLKKNCLNLHRHGWYFLVRSENEFLSKVGHLKFILFISSLSFDTRKECTNSLILMKNSWPSFIQRYVWSTGEARKCLLSKVVSEKLEINRSSWPPGPVAEQQPVCAMGMYKLGFGNFSHRKIPMSDSPICTQRIWKEPYFINTMCFCHAAKMPFCVFGLVCRSE